MLSEIIENVENINESSGKIVTPLDKTIKKIERATDNNDVAAAWIIAAKEILKDKRLTEAFEAILNIHLFFKNATNGVRILRGELINRAKDMLERKLSPADYERVWGSF